MFTSKELGKVASEYLRTPPLVPSLMPSLVFWVLECIWFLFSDPSILEIWKKNSKELQLEIIGAAIAVVWFTSVIFDICEPVLLRFFEGYIGSEWIWKLLWQGQKSQQKKFDELNAQIKELEPRIVKLTNPSAEEKIELEKNCLLEMQCTQSLFFRFPPARSEVLPTEMGNIIRAGEAYSFQRYGIDAVLMWSLLCEVLPENSKKLLNEARQNLACVLFLCASVIVFVLQSIVILLLLLLPSLPFSYKFSATCCLPTVVMGVAGYVGLLALIRCLNAPALSYADAIRRSFDLHRSKLLKALRIKTELKPCSEEERVFWKKVNSFVLRGYFLN